MKEYIVSRCKHCRQTEAECEDDFCDVRRGRHSFALLRLEPGDKGYREWVEAQGQTALPLGGEQ